MYGTVNRILSKDLLRCPSSGGQRQIDYAYNGFGSWDDTFSGYGVSNIPMTADYDGDRKADLSIKNNSGEWQIDFADNDGSVPTSNENVNTVNLTDINIYPNPSPSSVFNIDRGSLGSDADLVYQINDLLGQRINVIIDGEILIIEQKGIFIVNVFDKQNRFVGSKKVVRF